jgi:hypothetical protein
MFSESTCSGVSKISYGFFVHAFWDNKTLSMMWVPKVPKGTKRYQKVPKGTKRYQKVPKGTKRYQKVPKGTKRYQKVPKGTLVENRDLQI